MIKLIHKHSHNFLFKFLIVLSIAIVITYEISYDMPELYHNAGRHFTILYQFALSVISSTIFFYVQSYLPQKKKNHYSRYFLLQEYHYIITSIDFLFENLSELYLLEKKRTSQLSDDNLRKISLSLKNSDLIPAQFLFDKHMNVFECLQKCKESVDNSVDKIISNFYEVLDSSEIELLFKLSHNKMHNFIEKENMLFVISNLSGDPQSIKFDSLKEYQALYNFLKILSIRLFQ